MRKPGNQRGFTLLELIISISISALILPLVAGVIFMLQLFPQRTEADIQAQQDLQLVGQWVTIDANRASKISTDSLGENEYSVFSWTEYGGDSLVAVKVTYRYDAADTSLVREVTRNGVLDRISIIAQNIAAVDDVTFSSTPPTFELNSITGLYQFNPGRVTVTPRSTVEKIGIDPAVLTNTVVAQLRAQFTTSMPTPLPTGTPMPTRKPKRTKAPAPTETPPPSPPPAVAWIHLANTPGAVHAGGRLATDGAALYAFRGNAERDFWKFDVDTGNWTSLDEAPENVKEGGALAYGNGFIYALRGDKKKDFWRYDIASNTWQELADAPENVQWGGSLTWGGPGTIYGIRGANRKDFWKYDISNDHWIILASAPQKLDGGGSIFFVDGAVYALRGDNKKHFWKYTVAAGTWSTLADNPDSVDRGGSLTGDGGGYLFALRGHSSTDFWRYEISTDTWEPFLDTPQNVRDGGGLAYLNGELFALRGDETRDFWKFNTGMPPPEAIPILEPLSEPTAPSNTPPTASIDIPTDGDNFLTTDSITFSGSASDPEDGALFGGSLVWSSSLGDPIGSGMSFTASLGAGAHTITLTATDSLGASHSTSISVTVNTPPGNTPPTASIDSPTDGSTFLPNESIVFAGSAGDPEDGALTGGSLVWSSSLG
ncbi:MAG: prepilin-type N-terminal cleavage/methylation domain-containing protein, partial [Chloroflexi bacterium]|nr:prepilin-type N-terminal cleavage/methylation domain-containing protein [Chloroflexota bacterium]